jgi:hypothetical protein
MGVKTTDSEENYKAVLKYVQDLRNVPKQEGFPEAGLNTERKYE